VQKKNAAEGERPAAVKTHLRNMVIIPDMIGSVIGVYNGKVFLPVEVKVRLAGYVASGAFSCCCCYCWSGCGR
jgi:small subunit ribosomal protein S15e